MEKNPQRGDSKSNQPASEPEKIKLAKEDLVSSETPAPGEATGPLEGLEEKSGATPGEGANWNLLARPDFDLRAGILAHSFGPLAWGIESGTDVNFEFRFPLFDWKPFDWIWNPRFLVGATIALGNDTSQVYTGFLWRVNMSKSYFADLSVGLAAHNGTLYISPYIPYTFILKRHFSKPDKRQLGSSTLFRLSASFGYKINETYNIALTFDHISNAYLYRRNQGLDTTGFVVGMKF